GPGTGGGSGDTMFGQVIASPFLTTAIRGCPTRTASVRLSKKASPSGTLLPGRPMSFTVTITNSGSNNLYNLNGQDNLPAGFIFSQATGSGPQINNLEFGTGSSFAIPLMSPAQVAVITYSGKLDPSLNHSGSLTNTVTISNGAAGTLKAKAVVPFS